MSRKRLPFTKPRITMRDAFAVYRSLRTGWITRGKKVEELEFIVSQYCCKDETLCLDSATAGMEIALRFLGIGEGDEVITTAYTYSATADVIVNVGAKVVFADIGYDYCLDHEAVSKLVTDKTKAIIGVDIGGNPCNFSALMYVAKDSKKLFSPKTREQEKLGRIAVIADLAHSFGSEVAQYYDMDFVVCSFHAIKNITTGEGGSVSFSLWEGAYRKMFLLADHGQEHMHNANNWEYDIVLFGQNHIMTDQEAVLGISQMKRTRDIIAERGEITLEYQRQLEGYCTIFHRVGSTYHLVLARLPDEVDRDVLARCLYARGIPVNVHYKPLPLMTAYKEAGYTMEELPVTMKMFEQTMTLPLFNGMTKKQVTAVCDAIKKLMRAMR